MGSFKVSVYMMMMMIVLIAADSDLHYFHKTQNKLSSTRLGFNTQPQLPTLQKGHQFIIGGKYVNKISKYPYMAFVYRVVPGGNTGYCGGTILSRKYVLTAAHCIMKCKRITVRGDITCTIRNSEDYTIYVGSTIPNNALDKVKLKTYFIHPNFKQFDDLNKCEYNYDIAILELRTALKFNNKISSVKLPTFMKTRLTMKNCKILGWGKTQGEQNSKAYYTDVFLNIKLKSAKIHVISTKECLKHLKISHGNSSTNPDLDLCRHTHMCAIGPNSKNGVCSGDSGGPLICNGVQIGVVSAVLNSQCVGPHMPSFYTRLDINLQWINTITAV